MRSKVANRIITKTPDEVKKRVNYYADVLVNKRKMENKTEEKKIVIECECGTHLLVAQSIVEYQHGIDVDWDPQHRRFIQDFYLAMFNYGNYSEKPSFWRKIKVMWNYFKTGEMHLDEIIMTPEELLGSFNSILNIITSFLISFNSLFFFL